MSIPKKLQSVHAYGGICHKGVLGLFMVSGTTGLKSEFAIPGSHSKGVDAGEYGNILKNALIPTCKAKYGDTKKFVFM